MEYEIVHRTLQENPTYRDVLHDLDVLSRNGSKGVPKWSYLHRPKSILDIGEVPTGIKRIIITVL